MIDPIIIIYVAPTATSLTASFLNDDGLLNVDSLMTAASASAATSILGQSNTITNEITQKKVYNAKQYIESMSNEELSDLLKKVEGKEEESPKIYQK